MPFNLTIVTALGYGQEKIMKTLTNSGTANRLPHGQEKDILRFHSIYWPILLMMLDIKLPERLIALWLVCHERRQDVEV
ncbi:MAG: class I tRNA ligase family protein [Streptococcus sp.]